MDRTDKLASTIGAAARAARNALDRTQEDVADEIGIGVEFYSRIERGKTMPSVPTLWEIARVLSVSADDLLGLSETPHAKRETPVEHPDPDVRKLLRRIQSARPTLIRLLNLMVLEVNRSPKVATKPSSKTSKTKSKQKL